MPRKKLRPFLVRLCEEQIEAVDGLRRNGESRAAFTRDALMFEIKRRQNIKVSGARRHMKGLKCPATP